MDLKDTIEDMISDNYRERFTAEYNQALIRSRKLKNVIDDYYNESLTFALASPISLLESQYEAMVAYIGILVKRAEIENIQLKEVKR